MQLEQTIFVFSFADKDHKESKIDLKNSFLCVNGTITDILLSDIFSKITSFKDMSIKGYSLLEFSDDKGNICIEDSAHKLLNISFIDNTGEFFILSKKYNPQIRPNALNVDEQSLKQIVLRIENFLNKNFEKGIVKNIVFNNFDFNTDVDIAKEQGYLLIETVPRSNFYVLKKSNEDYFLVEVTENDYDIIDKTGYNISFEGDFFVIEKIKATV